MEPFSSPRNRVGWRAQQPRLRAAGRIERSKHDRARGLNCSPPDTGNMELLAMFGTDDQKERWLAPLLDGTTRSAFLMTEPDVAGSDATNIRCSIVRDGDDYVINGRKTWISGAADPRCSLGIVMGKTDPTAPTFRQQSMILVPFDSPGSRLFETCSCSATTTRRGTAR